MMSSDSLNWSLAILLSLLLYSSLLLQNGATAGIESSIVTHSPLVTRLTFNQATVPDAPPVKKTLKPKPVIAKKNKSVLMEKVENNEVEQKPAAASASPQPQGQEVNSSSQGLLKLKREQYFQQLLSHIESYKFYPRAARKRFIEGGVKIAFTLNDDGHYRQLELFGERDVLVNATRIALEEAVPLPVPAGDINISRRIEFTMAYSLTE